MEFPGTPVFLIAKKQGWFEGYREPIVTEQILCDPAFWAIHLDFGLVGVGKNDIGDVRIAFGNGLLDVMGLGTGIACCGTMIGPGVWEQMQFRVDVVCKCTSMGKR